MQPHSQGKDPNQAAAYCSSVDPGHFGAYIALYDSGQPGFDVMYQSTITRGLPMTAAVAMIYDDPENAAPSRCRNRCKR